MSKCVFQAIHIVVSGEVQGVGFRYSAFICAKEKNIKGWIKNNANGTVEAIAEGRVENVLLFQKWIKKGPPGAKVRKCNVETISFTGQFKEFSILD